MEDVAIAPQEAAAHLPVTPVDPEPAVVVGRSPEQAEQLVLDLIAAHADSLLRTARRYSLCADDAQDAYQRGLEILMRHAARLDADRAGGWLHTVVKHEALAINRSRSRSVGDDEVDFDTIEIRTAPSPEDRVLGFEQVARSAEALQRLKPQEVRALWLKAMGNSYQEICDATGWTYTKVNRCIAEGRKSFLARYAGIEAGEECRRWAPRAVGDGRRRGDGRADARSCARTCATARAAARRCASCAGRARRSRRCSRSAASRSWATTAGASRGRATCSRALWHALWGDVGERAATAAFRVQSVVEAIVPGQVDGRVRVGRRARGRRVRDRRGLACPRAAARRAVRAERRGGAGSRRDAEAGERAAPGAKAAAAGAGPPDAGSGGEATRAPGDLGGAGALAARAGGGRGAAASRRDRPACGAGARERDPAARRHAREAGGERVRGRDALRPTTLVPSDAPPTFQRDPSFPVPSGSAAMPLCFIEPQDAIRVIAESVGREARRQLLGELVRAWVDEIPEQELASHYAKAVADLDEHDLSMLAAWHASLEVGHPIANREFLVNVFPSLGDNRREALKIAAGFRGEEAFDAGVAEEQALDTVLPYLSRERSIELAAECLDLYLWDRLGSDN